MAESREPKPATRDPKNTYTIYDDNTVGTVQIADEVVAAIAGLAAAEVDGTAAVGGTPAEELRGKKGVRNAAKGVRIDVKDGIVHVKIILSIRYGYNIPDTCKKVQDRVKNALENMTGLEVAGVNISIADVMIEPGK